MSDDTTTGLNRRRLLQTIGASAGAAAFGAGTAAAAPTDENTVAYSDLSERGQELVAEAEASADGIAKTRDDLPPGVADHDYLTVDGTTYRMPTAVVHETKHLLNPTPSDPDPEQAADFTRDYADLPAEGQEMFDAALENGTYVTDGAAPPQVFGLYEAFVKKDGQHHELGFARANVPHNAVRLLEV